MDIKASRKLIVASAMAVAVAIAVTIFMRTPPLERRVARGPAPSEALVESPVAPLADQVVAAAPEAALDPGNSAAVTAVASDSSITTSVQAAIAADEPGQSGSFGVTTSGGAVVLTGNVASRAEIARLKRVVAAVKDVKSVDTSALSVSSP